MLEVLLFYIFGRIYAKSTLKCALYLLRMNLSYYSFVNIEIFLSECRVQFSCPPHITLARVSSLYIVQVFFFLYVLLNEIDNI